MKKSKKLIQISIVGLLLSLIFLPTIGAEDNNDNPYLEIRYVDQTGDTYYVSIELNNEQIQIFRETWTQWENYLKNIREDKELYFQETKELETKSIILLEEVKNLTTNPATGQIYFPPGLDISTFIHSHLFMMGLGVRIFSIGRGRAWLPFNRQGEAFIGIRFSPIIVSYSIGLTRVRAISLSTFSMSISNRFFAHRVCIAGFTGLYINFGKLFQDTSVGPVILIGKPLLISVGKDIF
jgi:hypothetical protein